MTSYEIVVYAPHAPPRTVHMGTSEADMHSHLNAVEGTLQPLDLLPPGSAHRVCATRAGGERMKVFIGVEYLGRDRYVIRMQN